MNNIKSIFNVWRKCDLISIHLVEILIKNNKVWLVWFMY